MFGDDAYESESSQNTTYGEASQIPSEKQDQKKTPKKTRKNSIRPVDKKNFKTKKGATDKKFKTIVKKISESKDNKKAPSQKKTINSSERGGLPKKPAILQQTAVKAFTRDILEALFQFNQGKW